MRAPKVVTFDPTVTVITSDPKTDVMTTDQQEDVDATNSTLLGLVINDSIELILNFTILLGGFQSDSVLAYIIGIAIVALIL